MSPHSTRSIQRPSLRAPLRRAHEAFEWVAQTFVSQKSAAFPGEEPQSSKSVNSCATRFSSARSEENQILLPRLRDQDDI